MQDDRLVGQLKNIGATIAKRLNEIGISTMAELQAVGAVKAFKLIQERNPNMTIAVCYYLYSLEGAIRNRHWDDLPEQVKNRLRQQAETEESVSR